MNRKVILINTGSPNSPKVKDVRKYLIQFLTDPNVIDIPPFFRYLLVYGIIAPFRAFRSAKLYEKLETGRGFPLVFHTSDLTEKIIKEVDEDLSISYAMRYGDPSLKKIIRTLEEEQYDEIHFIPLYPQFASSTTGSNIRFLQKELNSFQNKEKLKILLHFHHNNAFIQLWKKKISACSIADYDAVLYSFHGVPIRQTESAHPEHSCDSLKCKEEYKDINIWCYQASCYQTAREISAQLDIPHNKWDVAFQSRFGRKWLAPFTDQVIRGLARKGVRKLLVVSPAFVADCLETTIEIGHEYQSLFQKEGGQELTLVPSLNSDPSWAQYIAGLISNPNDYFINLYEADDKRGSNRF